MKKEIELKTEVALVNKGRFKTVTEAIKGQTLACQNTWTVVIKDIRNEAYYVPEIPNTVKLSFNCFPDCFEIYVIFWKKIKMNPDGTLPRNSGGRDVFCGSIEYKIYSDGKVSKSFGHHVFHFIEELRPKLKG